MSFTRTCAQPFNDTVAKDGRSHDHRTHCHSIYRTHRHTIHCPLGHTYSPTPLARVTYSVTLFFFLQILVVLAATQHKIQLVHAATLLGLHGRQRTRRMKTCTAPAFLPVFNGNCNQMVVPRQWPAWWSDVSKTSSSKRPSASDCRWRSRSASIPQRHMHTPSRSVCNGNTW